MKTIYDRAQDLKRQAPLGLLADALECIDERARELPEGTERRLIASVALRAIQAAMVVVQECNSRGVFNPKQYR